MAIQAESATSAAEAAVVEKDETNDAIDGADRAKYGRRYPTIVPSIVAPVARAATRKLIPR